MNDDRDQNNERFQQALDEMFGPQPGEPEPVAAPSPDPVSVTQGIEPSFGEPTPVSSSPSPPAPVGIPYQQPVERKRSWRRTAALGCAGALGLIVVCMAALVVIGLIAGDDDQGAVPVNDPVQAAFTVEPSYTVEPVGGTPFELVPIDTYVKLNDGWRVAIVGVTRDATDLVLAENQFNDPPDEGRQFLMVMVSVENTSGEPDYFPGEFLLHAMNDAGREYTTYDDFCGVVPDVFPYEDIQSGESATGNFCWSVLEEDADTLVLHSIPFLDTYAEHYFSLQP